eukprot:m.193515 g.193515  ORF g.193515 m.193515 type:complete len:55 (-) comp24983_c0_seq1:1468-1632(-)
MMSARAEVRLLCERGNLDRLKLVLNRINSSHKVTKSSRCGNCMYHWDCVWNHCG